MNIMKINVNFIRLGIILAYCSGIPVTALADLGNFTITNNCPATKSLRSNDNPGHVTVKSGETYTAINLNKPGGPYVLLRIPDTQPTQRWVKLTCGKLINGPAHGDEGQQPAGGESGASSKSGKFLLAASWQPAFCESAAGEDKKECVTETNDRFDATHFTLHGLWPQPRGNAYCRVSARDKRSDEHHNWDNLPEPTLSLQARAEVDKIMPGSQSNLQRHEWIKHGTCFGAGPEAYFRTAVSLMGQLNNSELQRLVATHIGREVTAADLRAAFEQTFGSGSADALVIECAKDGGRTLISGISINLQGVLNQASKLQNILDISQHPKSKCTQGVIDPVGKN
jgi:ribonuclease T2